MSYLTCYNIIVFAVKNPSGKFIKVEDDPKPDLRYPSMIDWLCTSAEYGGFEPFRFQIEAEKLANDDGSCPPYLCRLYLESDGAVWDWKSDMKELSSAFPDLVFKVHGEGGRTLDLWDAYICDQKIQMCHAEIPPFNPNKLK